MTSDRGPVTRASCGPHLFYDGPRTPVSAAARKGKAEPFWVFIVAVSPSHFAERDFCCAKMASSGAAVESGAPISLKDLRTPSPLFADGASLRVLGKLQEYSLETAVAIIVDGDATLKIDTQHLRDLSFRVGSIYQFIGELHIRPDDEAVLRARVGRNVDGLDLILYYQSSQLVRQFQAERTRNQST